MIKIVTVLGARPQFIKAAALSRVFRTNPFFDESIIHTGQHYDANMSDIFFQEMSIPRPDFFLQVNSQRHGEMTAKMLEGVEKILMEQKPDVVIVYGDTNSTLAGALAASKLHIPIAHVEAGLRSFNRKMPEEVNRVITDHLSQWLFCPTDAGAANLRREGIAETKIHKVGDIMFDTMRYYQSTLNEKDSIVDKLNLGSNEFVLVTIHRAENTNDKGKLDKIMEQLSSIAKETTVVFPLHPRTKKLLENNSLVESLKIIEPVGYLDMLMLQKHCRLIITDSGGVQKEAFFNHKFCITVREETEWVELVENGYNFLANPIEKSTELAKKLWTEPFADKGFNPYGDGHTAEKIASVLKEWTG